MIFDSIDFHNVEEMAKDGPGYRMLRLPGEVALQLGDKLRESRCYMSTGVELRFRLLDETVKIHLRVDPNEEAQTALIYYGSIQGGWQDSSKTIREDETVLTIRCPDNMEQLEEISEEAKLPFSPKMVRILLPYGACVYLGREGAVEPPHLTDTPSECYLAYGSSITHGSLGLITPCTYPYQIASRLGVDYLNQGYAGAAFMEREMAEYLVSRKDWTFASLELGINIVGTDLSDGSCERRIREFLQIFARDGREVFVTDIFMHNRDRAAQEWSGQFRAIVQRNACGGRLTYTPGVDLLSNREYISADRTHLTMEGQLQVAARWSEVMKRQRARR